MADAEDGEQRTQEVEEEKEVPQPTEEMERESLEEVQEVEEVLPEAAEVEEEPLEIDKDLLVEYKVHYGRQAKTAYSKDFIFHVHPKGFFLIDVEKTLEKLRVAARFLARIPADRVLLASGREYARQGIEKMSELTGMRRITGRFTPGVLTNYVLEHHQEVDLVFVVDPYFDYQQVKEAARMKVPVMSFSDTNAFPRLVDLVVPANSKGRHSLAVLFWSLTNLYLRERGMISEDDFIEESIDDFMVTYE